MFSGLIYFIAFSNVNVYSAKLQERGLHIFFAPCMPHPPLFHPLRPLLLRLAFLAKPAHPLGRAEHPREGPSGSTCVPSY